MSTRLATLLAVVLVLVILVPQSNASFTTNPTFDLKTNSNIAGATDAVYTLHLENKDKSQDTLSVSITIPAGYAISQKFITDKTGVRAGSAYGHCPAGSATASLATTATPGRFKISFMGMAQSDVIVIEPTAATPGTMEFSFTGTYAVMNSGCYADVTTVEGFFVNPSTLGTYIWAPSMATPRSAPESVGNNVL